MGKQGAAEFYELFKKTRDQEENPTIDSSVLNEQLPEQKSAPRLDLPHVEEESFGSDELEESDTGETASSIQVEVSGREASASESYAYPSRPSGLTSRPLMMFVMFAIVLFALVGSYLVGQRQGRDGATFEPILNNTGEAPSLSANRQENAERVAPPPRRESTLAKQANPAERVAPPAAGQPAQQQQRRPAPPSGKKYTLILAQYLPRTEKIAKLAAMKLNDDGFPQVGLAKGRRFIYMYCGSYNAKDDPKLLQYKVLFSGRKEFKDCFITSMHFK